MSGVTSDRCRGPMTMAMKTCVVDNLSRARYWALIKKMQEEYLEELLEMQALCSFLSCLHGAQQPEVRKLQQLNARHLRPLVDRLQLKQENLRKMHVSEKDVAALQKLRMLLTPFMQDFRQTAHSLRCRAMKERRPFCTARNSAAAAA